MKPENYEQKMKIIESLQLLKEFNLRELNCLKNLVLENFIAKRIHSCKNCLL